MMSPNFIDHAYFYFSERKITVADDDGYDETVQFEFTTDGAEGYAQVVEFLKSRLPSDSLTYCFN